MEESPRPQWIRGRASRQAHADLPEGTVEEEHGREGFSGAASHLYRLRPPTGWSSIDGPLRPHALDANKLPTGDRDGLPVVLLENADLRIGWWTRPEGTSEWFLRNAQGDALYLVHDGEGRLETEYGPLAYRAGDYLLVPRGTTHRVAATAATRLLTVEAVGGCLRLPDRGLLGRHALFDPAMIEVPEAEAIDEEGEFTVVVKREGHDTTVVYPFHPTTSHGWNG